MNLLPHYAKGLSAKWNGDQGDTEWLKFRCEFEAMLTSRWAQQKLDREDAELKGERARRETDLLRAYDALAKHAKQGLGPGKVFLCYRREDSGDMPSGSKTDSNGILGPMSYSWTLTAFHSARTL